MHNYSINFSFFFQRKGLSWLQNKKKERKFLLGGSDFDDQGFTSFYQTFCYKISWNYLKFWGIESEQSLILHLNPSPSVKFYVSNGVFFAGK